MKNVIIHTHTLGPGSYFVLNLSLALNLFLWGGSRIQTFKGQIIGTNFAFLIAYLNVLQIQQSTKVRRGLYLTSSGRKV